jgi:hypothetical protein
MGGRFMYNPGASRRGIAEVCLAVESYLAFIARSDSDEAIQLSVSPRYGLLR